MADNITNTTVLSNLLSTYYYRQALTRLVSKAIAYDFAQKVPLPKGEGKAANFNAWSNFGEVSAAITEGTNPSLKAVCTRQVSATVAQYMRGVKLTDLAEYTSSLDAYSGIVSNLTDAAVRSVDKVLYTKILKTTLNNNKGAKEGSTNILSAWVSCTASAFHSGDNGKVTSVAGWGFPVVLGTTATRLSAVTTVGVSSQMSLFAIRKTVKILRRNNVMEFADGKFKMITNTDAFSDLRSDPAWRSWFSDAQKIQEGMQDLKPQGPAPSAAAEGCNIYESNVIPYYRAAHSCDVSFIFGEGAYGCTQLGNVNNKGFEIIVKRPGPSDTSNPGNLYGTLSFKFALGPAALNTSAGRILITHAKA